MPIGKELFYMKTKHSLYRNQKNSEEAIFHSNCLLFIFLHFSGLPSCLYFNKTLGYYSTNPKTWLWFLLATARSCSSSLVWFSHTARLRAQQTNMPNLYAIPSKLCSQISIKSDIGLSKIKQTSSKRRGTYFVWGKSGNNWHLKDKQAPKASEQQSVTLKVQEKKTKDLLTIFQKVSCAYFHRVSAREQQSLFVVV